MSSQPQNNAIHILGQTKPHEPRAETIINESTNIGGVTLTIKVGITSVSAKRWRAWYAPVINGKLSDVVYLAAPPGGLTEERARGVATVAGQLQATIVAACLSQVTEDATIEQATQARMEAAKKTIENGGL